MAALFQLLAQFAEIEDLAVEDQADAVVGAQHRLVAGDQIDHRQPAMAEAKTGLEMMAVAIRAAMAQWRRSLRAPARDPAAMAFEVKPADYAAH